MRFHSSATLGSTTSSAPPRGSTMKMASQNISRKKKKRTNHVETLFLIIRVNICESFPVYGRMTKSSYMK